MKKTIAFLLCVAMMLSILPMAVFAEGNTGEIVLPADCFHSYIYTDNEDGETHTVTCKYCDGTYSAAHSFVNGVCVCGATEAPVDHVDPELTFSSHSLDLGDSIAINFIIENTKLTYDSYRIVIEKDLYDAIGNIVGVDTTEYDAFARHNSTKSKIQFKNVAAIDMTADIRATIYGTKDGVEYHGNTDVYSVETYAVGRFTNATTADSLKTVCANLLNYGAAAQIYKNYNTGNLANRSFAEHPEYAAYAGDRDDLSLTAVTDRTSEAGAVVSFTTNVLNLESKIEVPFIFTRNDAGIDMNKLTFEISYIDAYDGKTVITNTYSAADIAEHTNGRFKITINTLDSLNLSSTMTAKAYYDGVLQSTAVYSVESYCASRYMQDTAIGNLCATMMLYGYSARAHFVG